MLREGSQKPQGQGWETRFVETRTAKSGGWGGGGVVMVVMVCPMRPIITMPISEKTKRLTKISSGSSFFMGVSPL